MFFEKICWKHDTPLPLLNINYSSAFYSTLLLFLVLKIFGFNLTSLFVRYFGSISRFKQFVPLWRILQETKKLSMIHFKDHNLEFKS